MKPYSVTARTHGDDGVPTISELDRRHRTWQDGQTIKTSCARCDWSIDVLVTEARAQFEHHLEQAHPEHVRKTKRRASGAPVRDILDGQPVVVVPAEQGALHLPSTDPRPASLGRPVTLDELTDADGLLPALWRALCGARGGLRSYDSTLYTRVPCAGCMRVRKTGEATPGIAA